MFISAVDVVCFAMKVKVGIRDREFPNYNKFTHNFTPHSTHQNTQGFTQEGVYCINTSQTTILPTQSNTSSTPS